MEDGARRDMNPSEDTDRMDRRQFIGVAAGTAGAMLIKPSLVRGTAANSAVRVGVLGCGGRGTEDATNLVDTGGARVVALADMFQDQLDVARAAFDKKQTAKGYTALDPSQLFVGPKAYEKIVASQEVDAVVIATPPYFHPHHLEGAVAAGKHVYLEKPVAVDVPGAMKVIDVGKRAEGKLSLDVGFQIRDCPPFVELVRRIHGGALGNIVCGEAYYLTGYLNRPVWPNASPVERRLRNWVYDRALSGDIIVEQNIHVVDICNWILRAHPQKATATGGRAGRPAADGDVFGNYNVVFHLSGPSGCDFQLDTVCEGLVGRDGEIFRHEGYFAVAVRGTSGDLGRRAVAGSHVDEESGPAGGIFGDGKFYFESRACGPGEEEGVCGEHYERAIPQSVGKGRGVGAFVHDGAIGGLHGARGDVGGVDEVEGSLGPEDQSGTFGVGCTVWFAAR